MSEQSEQLTEALTTNGHRLTASRRTIIEALVDSRGHITADELAARVRCASANIGRMTVYRTLDLLCELGLIRPIYQGTGAAHYILLDGGSHHHLICTSCHRVFDFERCAAGELAEILGRQFNFQVQSHLLEVYGLCEACKGNHALDTPPQSSILPRRNKDSDHDQSKELHDRHGWGSN